MGGQGDRGGRRESTPRGGVVRGGGRQEGGRESFSEEDSEGEGRGLISARLC